MVETKDNLDKDDRSQASVSAELPAEPEGAADSELDHNPTNGQEDSPDRVLSDDSGTEKRGLAPSPWLLLLVGIVVGILAGFNLRPLVTPGVEPANEAPLAGVESSPQINEPDPHQSVMLAVIAGARHFYGDPNAPITLVEFGDFNCGYCGRWALETLPQIDEKYIQTGQVRMAYVHFPILGADSMTAAEASECAALQGSFWDYHNLVYAHQGIGYSPDNLTELAGQLDLDTAAFEECLSSFPDRTSLEDDIRLARVMGVRGTPAFLVNGIPLAGAYPYEDFEQIIEGTLAGEY
jgi:protein-disulfide isomerase